MTNRYGITLDPGAQRWAAAEGVSETVIAAICLLPERSIDEVVAKLTLGELEQVIEILARYPSCCPPGALAVLIAKRNLSPQPSTESRTANGAKMAKPGTPTGTSNGTRAETARRRMVVEDLMKAGLSIRTIAAGTRIPRSSVHRATRAIAKAQARQEIAVTRIAQKLLGKKLSRGRG